MTNFAPFLSIPCKCPIGACVIICGPAEDCFLQHICHLILIMIT